MSLKNIFHKKSIKTNNLIKGKTITYAISETIGKGNFGKVKIAYNILNKNEKYACKIIDESNMKNSNDLIHYKREIEILTQLEHKNVIKTFEIIKSNTIYYLIMEYCEKGELFNYIVSKKRFNDKLSSFFFYQLISGLSYIHKKNICHRDLKPENLLLTNNYTLKIIDFGLSNFEEDSLLSTPCGSPSYASPEMIAQYKYNGFLNDIWSTGVILYAMLCGYLPFDEKEGDVENEFLFQNIEKCEIDYPEYINADCKDILEKIFVKDCEKRITIKKIKQHSFYKMGKSLYKQIHQLTKEISDLNNDKKNDLNRNNSDDFSDSIDISEYDIISNNNLNCTDENKYDEKEKDGKKSEKLIKIFDLSSSQNIKINKTNNEEGKKSEQNNKIRKKIKLKCPLPIPHKEIKTNRDFYKISDIKDFTKKIYSKPHISNDNKNTNNKPLDKFLIKKIINNSFKNKVTNIINSRDYSKNNDNKNFLLTDNSKNWTQRDNNKYLTQRTFKSKDKILRKKISSQNLDIKNKKNETESKIVDINEILNNKVNSFYLNRGKSRNKSSSRSKQKSDKIKKKLIYKQLDINKMKKCFSRNSINKNYLSYKKINSSTGSQKNKNNETEYYKILSRNFVKISSKNKTTASFLSRNKNNKSASYNPVENIFNSKKDLIPTTSRENSDSYRNYNFSNNKEKNNYKVTKGNLLIFLPKNQKLKKGTIFHLSTQGIKKKSRNNIYNKYKKSLLTQNSALRTNQNDKSTTKKENISKKENTINKIKIDLKEIMNNKFSITDDNRKRLNISRIDCKKIDLNETRKKNKTGIKIKEILKENKNNNENTNKNFSRKNIMSNKNDNVLSNYNVSGIRKMKKRIVNKNNMYNKSSGDLILLSKIEANNYRCNVFDNKKKSNKI